MREDKTKLFAVAPGRFIVIIGTMISAQGEGKTLHHVEVQTFPKTLLPREGSSLQGCPAGLQGSQDLGYVMHSLCSLPTRKKKVNSPQSVKTRCPHSAIAYVDQRCIFSVVKPRLKENISTWIQEKQESSFCSREHRDRFFWRGGALLVR